MKNFWICFWLSCIAFTLMFDIKPELEFINKNLENLTVVLSNSINC